MNVKGVAFLARQSMLMARLGEDNWRNFVREYALGEPFFKQPVMPVTQIPAEIFLAFNDAVVERFFGNDAQAYWAFGGGSGEYALREGPLKNIYGPGDLKRFVLFTPSIWKGYYTAGELTASVDGDFANVHTRSPVPHVYFEYTAMGFVKAGLEMLGSKPVEYKVIKGYSRGDPESHYRFKFG